jgi:hypothetical protein
MRSVAKAGAAKPTQAIVQSARVSFFMVSSFRDSHQATRAMHDG